MRSVFGLTLLLLLAASSPLRAQTATPSEAVTAQQSIAWLLLNSTVRFHDRLSLYVEAQPRFFEFSSMQQLLLRGALNVHLHPDLLISAGYGFVETWAYGAFPSAAAFPEHRLWEQAQLNSQVGRVRFQNRARLEQRFIGQLSKDSDGDYFVDGYQETNRFRHLLRITVPLNRTTMTAKTVFISLYDEIFLNFGSPLVKANLFDQNRATASLGYHFTDDFNLQLGYINQLIEKSDGLRFESNHGLLVTVTYNPDVRRRRSAAPAPLPAAPAPSQVAPTTASDRFAPPPPSDAATAPGAPSAPSGTDSQAGALPPSSDAPTR